MIKLLCYPCAGGSAQMYFKWKKNLSEFVEVVPIELAGRGKRSNEPMYENFKDMIQDAFIQTVRLIDNDTSYILLGFSMGAILAYEVYQLLRKQGIKEPLHIFILGREAPDCKIKKIGDLPDDLFLKEIISYDGIPKEIYDNKNFLRIFIGTLRNDFRLLESYENLTPSKILIPVSVLWGRKDKSIRQDQMKNWKQICPDCNFFNYDGGHFFINSSEEQVLMTIKSIINEIGRR